MVLKSFTTITLFKLFCFKDHGISQKVKSPYIRTKGIIMLLEHARRCATLNPLRLTINEHILFSVTYSKSIRNQQLLTGFTGSLQVSGLSKSDTPDQLFALVTRFNVVGHLSNKKLNLLNQYHTLTFCSTTNPLNKEKVLIESILFQKNLLNFMFEQHCPAKIQVASATCSEYKKWINLNYLDREWLRPECVDESLKEYVDLSFQIAFEQYMQLSLFLSECYPSINNTLVA